MIRRPMTASDYERERRARETTDRYKNRYRTDRERPDPDPHVVVFADGCATWLGYQQPEHAQRALARLNDDGVELFDGARIVPYLKVKAGTYQLRFSRENGMPLRPWHDCPDHRPEPDTSGREAFGRVSADA